MLTCLLRSHTAVSQAPRSGFVQNPGAWPSQLDSSAPAVTTTPLPLLRVALFQANCNIQPEQRTASTDPV